MWSRNGGLVIGRLAATLSLAGLTFLLCQPLSAQILPKHITKSSNQTLWWITQTGLGGSGEFQISNSSNKNSALLGTTQGQGPGVSGSSVGGYGGLFTTTGPSWAVYAQNNFITSAGGLGGPYYGAYGILDAYGSSGVYGQNDSGYGVQGRTSTGQGVFGYSTGSGDGIYGFSNGGNGIIGVTGNSSSNAVVGINNGSGSGGTLGGPNYGVSGSGATYGLIGQSSNGTAVMGQTTNGFGIFGYSNGSGYAGYFNGNVTVTGTFSNPSDARFKTNIRTLPNALEAILSIRGVTFDYRQRTFPNMNFGKGHQIGLIAQEVEKVLPELVSKDRKGYLSVDYIKVVPVLVEAIKDQQRQIAVLQAKLRTTVGSPPARIEEGARPIARLNSLPIEPSATLWALGIALCTFSFLQRRRR